MPIARKCKRRLQVSSKHQSGDSPGPMVHKFRSTVISQWSFENCTQSRRGSGVSLMPSLNSAYYHLYPVAKKLKVTPTLVNSRKRQGKPKNLSMCCNYWLEMTCFWQPANLSNPWVFFLEFCHKAGKFEVLIEFISKKIEFFESSIVFLNENAMVFW